MESKKHFNLLAVAVPGHGRTVLLTEKAISVGDMVRYRAAGSDILAEVVSVIRAEQNSELLGWIHSASPEIASRTVVKVWHADSTSVSGNELNTAAHGW